MSDQVRAAIVSARKIAKSIYAHSTSMDNSRNVAEVLDILAKAAEGTLPTDQWGVSAGMGWVYFDTLDAALEAAKVEILGGNEVQIKHRGRP